MFNFLNAEKTCLRKKTGFCCFWHVYKNTLSISCVRGRTHNNIVTRNNICVSQYVSVWRKWYRRTEWLWIANRHIFHHKINSIYFPHLAFSWVFNSVLCCRKNGIKESSRKFYLNSQNERERGGRGEGGNICDIKYQ